MVHKSWSAGVVDIKTAPQRGTRERRPWHQASDHPYACSVAALGNMQRDLLGRSEGALRAANQPSGLDEMP